MSGAEREAARRAFLAQAGWADAALAPLDGDASTRRYDRARGLGGRRAILMDAGAEGGPVACAFLALTGWLRAQGFSAPEIWAEAAGQGLLLIEDLGEALVARIAAGDPGVEAETYAAAVDLLAALGRLAPPLALPAAEGCHAIPPYDQAVLLREARILAEWYLPLAAAAAPSPDLLAVYEGLVAEACASVAGAAGCLTLRDYHAENLVWLPGRAGLARIGLLDYQDALRGHPAYDLVSLLEDARRDTAAELREAMIARFLAQAAIRPEPFGAAYATLGAQRNLKIIGIFARLWLRDGKPGYLRLIPRVWGHLMRDLAHPALAGLCRFVTAHVPAPGPAILARIAGAGR
ncbi:MAG TPA: phosphotransferase [Paracoccaceae bacterium]|nr:phosphotransferase [Paracoccaceae bacterium]